MRVGRVAAAVWLVALGGMGMGHWLTYVLARPHAHERAELLQATGHGVWGPLALTGAMALFAAGAAAALVAILKSRGSTGSRVRRFAVPLIGLQCGSFVAVEIIERTLGSGHGDVWGGGVLVAGLLVQAVAAAASLAIGALFNSVIGAVRRRASAYGAPRLRFEFALPATANLPHQATHFGTPRLRGPPARL